MVKDTKKYSRQLEMAFNGKFDILQGQKLDEAVGSFCEFVIHAYRSKQNLIILE